MAKEHVTLRFRDSSKQYFFVAIKPGRRLSADEDALQDEFLKCQLGPVVIKSTTGKNPGFVISLNPVVGTNRLKVLHRVRSCFVGAGYTIQESSKQ